MDIIQKTRDDYNKIAKYFAETRNHAGELVKFRPLIKDGQHILDWGCGNGRLLFLLDNFEINYFGVDQSIKQIKLAKKLKPKISKKIKTKFFCNAHREKKFPENYFDIAFAIASLHHLPDEKSRLQTLVKINRELKPEGKLILTTWNLESNWAKEKLKKDWKKLGEGDFLVPWKDQNGNSLVERYYHNFKKTEMEDLLKKSGWKKFRLYYSTGVDETNRLEGRNLVVEAEK